MTLRTVLNNALFLTKYASGFDVPGFSWNAIHCQQNAPKKQPAQNRNNIQQTMKPMDVLCSVPVFQG